MESEIKEDLTKYSPNDPELVDKIVNTIKSKGIFDQFRKDCLADVDTKPAYQNLQRRVNGSVNSFLKSHKWPCAQNKTQLRESVRKHTVKQSFLEAGVDRIVDQVVMPKIYSVFHPKVEEIVYELLGLEKPKPKPKKPEPKSILEMKLDFQNFKKSLAESISTEKKRAPDRVESSPAPSCTQNELSQGPSVKEEAESQPNYPDAPNTPPPLETNGNAVSDVQPDDIASSPASHKSATEVLNNDDDSNTIDEMPLLAASIDSSNRATTPVLSTAKNDSNTKVDSSSDSDSHSLSSSHPPMEFDSSTNNLSSLKSDCKASPSKKFDNFSNLGEKLKQSDVNLRETTLVKAEETTEESSEVTKSSEHDSESLDLNMEVHSDSNTSVMDRYVVEKNETLASLHYSDDSMSSAKSKSKSQDFKKNDKSHSHKQMNDNKPKNPLPDQIGLKAEKDKERSSRNPEGDQKEHSKSSSKYSESKAKHRDSSKDKSKSHRHRDEKHRTKDAHSSERNGKDGEEKKDKSDVDCEKKGARQKNDSSKSASDDSDRRKKKEEKSRHSKEDRDSKGTKKGDDRIKGEDKGNEKFKTPEKEKKSDDRSRTDRHKTKTDSSSKTSHSTSEDRRSRDEKNKNDRKNRDDDKNDKRVKDDDRKKDSKKRKSGRCDESDSKSKNSRRSSDRDSNGNAGGGSDKPNPASSSQAPKKSSKSEKKTRSRYKDPSNSDAVEDDDQLQVTDEVDLILLQINNSIENEQHRLDVREILSETGVTPSIKPKIAKNFHEIRKIMQARKNIDRLTGIDAGLSPSNETSVETLPSKSSEILQDNEKELSFTDPSENDGNEMTRDEVDKIELKGLSVVITDIMKESSNSVSKCHWDPTNNAGMSFFLGSDDEIIRIEQCSEISETQPDDNGSLPPTKESPENVSPITQQRTTERLTPTDFIQSCADVSPLENVVTPSSASHEDRTDSDDVRLLACEASKVSVSVHADLPKLDTKLVETSMEGDYADEDKNSTKSDSSDRSQISQKEIADCIPTIEDDAVQRTPEEFSKRSSADTLPSRSTTRKNAGTRMYAILEEVSSSKHSNSPADRGVKKKTSKSRNNSDTERHSRPVSPRAFEMVEQSSMAEEAPSSKDRIDDGSDVSNKENDEAGASGTVRMKNQKADQPGTVETRSARKKNPVLDKLDESSSLCKPDCGKTSGTITRVSLSSKNENDPETMIENDSEKSCLDDTARLSTRRSTSSLNTKVRDSDEEWLLKTNSSSCSKSESVRKSLESLQMEKENLTVLRITPSQSSEPNALQTLSPSPRRKSCPDILHPRDHCENKDPLKGKSASASDGGVSGSDTKNDAKVDGSGKAKISAIKLPKDNDVPQQQFEYHTRNINNRRKSISTDKGDKKQDSLNENKKSTFEKSESKIELALSCKPPSITSANDDDKMATEGQGVKGSGNVTARKRRPVACVEDDNCSERSNEEEISRCVNPNFGSSKGTGVSVLSAMEENPNLTEDRKTEKETEDEKMSTPSEEMVKSKTADEQMTQPDVHNFSDELQRKSARISKKKAPPSVPEEELPDSSINEMKDSVLPRKQKTASADESESKLKEDKKILDKPVSNPSTSNFNERPKRKISLPSWRSDDAFVTCMQPKTEGNNKSNNSIVPVQTVSDLQSSQPCDDSKQSMKTVIPAEVGNESKRSTESGGATKSIRSSKRAVTTCEEPSTKGNDNDDVSVLKVPNGEPSGVELKDLQINSDAGNSKNKYARLMNKSLADSLLEDSASGSSLEFKGFSEDDAELDSGDDCLGFSDREIKKAAAQLYLLTHFIANRHSSVAKSYVNSQPRGKKMRVSSEGAASNVDAGSQSVSKAAKKRKLSLSSTPEKDNKDVLVGQCKAESKDSGLCESPEQPSFVSKIGQKTTSVDHRTPGNGIRTKPVRTPTSRPERNNKTESLVKTDGIKLRNSQRYCASDLYKPRPSFARDVRAVKRTASPAEASTLGRAKKRSR